MSNTFPKQGLGRFFPWPELSSRHKRKGLATGFYQLHRLMESGVGLSDALDDVASSETRQSAVLLWRKMASSVRSGQEFSAVLSLAAARIDSVTLALIKAGEANGQLAEACANVHAHLHWQNALRARLSTILVYPLFSLSVSLLVVGFLLVSVVPSIEGFLINSEVELQWHSIVLIDMSAWLSENTLGLLSTFVLLVLLAGVCLRASPMCQHLAHVLVLRLPLLGKLLLQLSLGRYTRCVSQLYGSGIALESALQIGEQAVANQSLQLQLIEARESMIAGESLSSAFGAQTLFSPLYVRMVGLGESSGQLHKVLNELAQLQQSSSDETLARVEQLIAPVLMLFIGSVLLWIVISALGPVYDMAIATAVGFS